MGSPRVNGVSYGGGDVSTHQLGWSQRKWDRHVAELNGLTGMGIAAAGSALRRADGDLGEAERILSEDAEILGTPPFSVNRRAAERLGEAMGAKWTIAAYALARADGDVEVARGLLEEEGFVPDEP